MDDRIKLTIGKRIIDARKCGFPFVIVVGKSCLKSNPSLEVHNIYNASCDNIVVENIVIYFKYLLQNCN